MAEPVRAGLRGVEQFAIDVAADEGDRRAPVVGCDSHIGQGEHAVGDHVLEVAAPTPASARAVSASSPLIDFSMIPAMTPKIVADRREHRQSRRVAAVLEQGCRP